MKGFQVRTFIKGQIIFREEEAGDTAYVLTEGKVEISSRVEGRKKVLAVLEPVNVLGEMVLVQEGKKRTATATCLEDCRLVAVTRDNFQHYLDQSPPFISALINVLVQRLRTATRLALRVPNLMQALVLNLNFLTRSGLKSIPLSDLCATMGCYLVQDPAEIEKKLGEMAGEGWVTIEGEGEKRTVSVADVERMARFDNSCRSSVGGRE